MSRKSRGAKGRLASPAQMARLRAVLNMQLTQPISFESYRHMMRSHNNPGSNVEAELAAWEHLEKKHATPMPEWARCGRMKRPPGAL